MIRIPSPHKPRKQESTIALINVVFLMLIFFLIAGTLAPPRDPEVSFITTTREENAAPPDMLFIAGDGRATWRGEPVEIDSELAGWAEEHQGAAFRIAADRDLPATELVDIVGALRTAGLTNIVLVTEHAAE
ncbi:MAG: biopolymer transporter ExbD [Rhizobiales bacterium]|nr:biopolymer transporter ExbD [Hyphomicrobiales bacterium]MBA70854.1 biopolymer transporter ExbD [Hyphomicrobiales bacterium]|tara:strand:+ start:359 stop:754 length:396 start_codon:yes stop_codon:yes gene_type:complete